LTWQNAFYPSDSSRLLEGGDYETSNYLSLIEFVVPEDVFSKRIKNFDIIIY